MDDLAPPTLVRAAGRLEAFDAGRISRALFAAAESAGDADPFLARELADGVVHFLSHEYGEGAVTPEQIAEVVAKTVRELGHPALAAAYAARRSSSADEGYGRDVRAAQDAGLLRLDDISRLAAWALPEGASHERAAVINRNLPSADLGPLFGPGPAADIAVEAPGHAPAIDWHLPPGEVALPPLPVTAFVLDRPRRPVSLGLGVDREHPAAMTRVGLNLVGLANRPGLLADVEKFLLRLGSLARIALDAGVRKREHLRALAGGFTLERARLVAVAEGLDEAVRLFTGWGLANGGPSLDLGCRIAARLREVFRKDGRAAHLETFLEIDVAGGAGMSLDAQLDAGDAIHAECDGGTLYIHGEAAEVLGPAASRTHIHRIVIR
jgi:hypothetical protein